MNKKIREFFTWRRLALFAMVPLIVLTTAASCGGLGSLTGGSSGGSHSGGNSGSSSGRGGSSGGSFSGHPRHLSHVQHNGKGRS